MLARDPDRVLAPDTAFVRTDRLPLAGRGLFFEGPPDLAVEVRSRSDRWVEVVEKCGIWIAHGTRLVWAIDPETRVVEVFEPGKRPRALLPGDALTGDPVLPDFSVPVADLFADVP